MINKFVNAAKYAWKNLLWLPVAGWLVGSLIAHTPSPAAAFDAGINAPAIYYSGSASSETAVITTTKTFTIDLKDNQFNYLSAQVSWSTVTVKSISFTDGNASTATITIASNTALAAATSWITITVGSNTAMGGATSYIAIVISSNSALDRSQLTLTLSSSPFAITYSSFAGAPYINYSTPTPGSVQTLPSSFTFVEGRDWYRSGGIANRGVDFASQTAVNIANAINYSTYGVTATTSPLGLPLYISTGSNEQNGIVFVLARSYGKYANNFQLQSSTQFAMTVCYSTAGSGLPNQNQFASTPTAFTGGRDPAFIRVTSTATFTYIAGRDFFVDPFGQGSSATATSLALALNVTSQSAQGFTASTATMFGTANAFNNQFSSAIYSPSVVILRAVTPGTFANSWSVTSSTQFGLTVAYSTGFQNGTPNPAFTLARSSALVFNGGLDDVRLKVNGIPLVLGKDWFVGAYSSATALSISSAVAFNVRLTTNVIVSTASMYTNGYSVIYMTSSFVNHNEFSLTSSSQFALAISTDPQGFSTMTVFADGSSTGSFKGGFASQIDTTTLTISTVAAPGYTWPLGMAVLFSTTAGQTPPGALVNNATYFITSGSNTALSAQRFSLATHSTGAVAGIPWLTGLSTQNAQGGNTYTITQAPWLTTTGIIWQFSNDATNWFNVRGTSITINQNSLGTGSTYYDLGALVGTMQGGTNNLTSFRYAREIVSGSSNTAVSVQTNILGKY